MTLRKEIFWAESMGDDKVVDAVLASGGLKWRSLDSLLTVLKQGASRLAG